MAEEQSALLVHEYRKPSGNEEINQKTKILTNESNELGSQIK